MLDSNLSAIETEITFIIFPTAPTIDFVQVD